MHVLLISSPFNVAKIKRNDGHVGVVPRFSLFRFLSNFADQISAPNQSLTLLLPSKLRPGPFRAKFLRFLFIT